MFVDEDTDEDGNRDIMGEMEIVAQLMITGGEAPEAARMTRSDRRMIRDAIFIRRRARTAKRLDAHPDARRAEAFYAPCRAGDAYEGPTPAAAAGDGRCHRSLL